MFIFLSQITALNPTIRRSYLLKLAESINLNAFKPQLPNSEILGILNSILKLNSEGELLMIYNQERRILYNPDCKLSFKEKMAIINKELGNMKREQTLEKIYESIESWDFEVLGKITQKKVASTVELHVSTIKRYWNNFKDYVGELNKDYKASDGIEISCEFDYSNFIMLNPTLKKSA